MQIKDMISECQAENPDQKKSFCVLRVSKGIYNKAYQPIWIVTSFVVYFALLAVAL